MQRPFVAFLGLALMACAGGPTHVANAQTTQAPPCSGAEYRQLDFWVGSWDVRWEASATLGVNAGQGTNTITREYDNCVIQEQFSGGPSTGNLIGHSVSTYHAQVGAWRQAWVDNYGGFFSLTGGPVGERFVLTNARLSEQALHRRMVFEDITPTSLTWRWQGSTDGENWSNLWTIHYTRRAAP